MLFKTGLMTLCATFVLAFYPTVAAQQSPTENDSAEENSEFVMVPPISVAMYNKRKRPSGTMTVQMQLKIENDDQRAQARKVMPRLKSAYTQETAQLAANFFDVSRPVNANLLGRSLQKTTDRLLKHGDARVLIGDIAVHRR